MEKEQGEEQNTKPTNQNKKVTIQIPSYQEVIESSQIKPTQTQASSLFKPSQTFSQAFSFIKNSEFYAPPPQPPPSEHDSNSSATTSEKVSPSPPVSAPTALAASSSSQSNQNRNAILVSHRQKGNPLLKHIRTVRWAFADVVCDYLLGQRSCALYLRLHLLPYKGATKELQASSRSLPC